MKRLWPIHLGSTTHIYMLGQLYLRKEEYKMARELLGIVAKSSAEEQVRSHAEQLLKQIQHYEDAKSSLLKKQNATATKAGRREPVMDLWSKWD